LCMSIIIENNHLEQILETLDSATIESSPNLLLASLFWEDERRDAALLCYKHMRWIDDLVDDAKSQTGFLNDAVRQSLIAAVNDWLKTILEGSDKELNDVVKAFNIPSRYWESFARSMLYDVDHTGFKSMADFIKYAEGAAVAPASLFMHFCGVIKKGNSYSIPEFNCIEIARPCALFSYMVHIIRDFQIDQLNHLNYFAEDIIQAYGLNSEILSRVAKGAIPDDNFRKMMEYYKGQASFYRKQTMDSIQTVSPLVLPEYRISIEVIFALYDYIFNLIDTQKINFTAKELTPEPVDIRNALIKKIVSAH
jgi:phytoene/squalene synthetase